MNQHFHYTILVKIALLQFNRPFFELSCSFFNNSFQFFLLPAKLPDAKLHVTNYKPQTEQNQKSSKPTGLPVRWSNYKSVIKIVTPITFSAYSSDFESVYSGIEIAVRNVGAIS